VKKSMETNPGHGWRGRTPGLRGRGAPLRHEPGDGALGDVEAELQELSVDARCPHKGFAAAIFLTRAEISALMGGRPPVGRPESWVQCWRKRWRCHRRTVSGATITRARLHPVQTLAKDRALKARAAEARSPRGRDSWSRARVTWSVLAVPPRCAPARTASPSRGTSSSRW
jgi:hypothetical protein